jgi:excisionase family DNA binding protein
MITKIYKNYQEFMEDKELLSPMEISIKLRIPYRTVAWWIQNKIMPSYRFGRHVRVHKKDLISWINSCRKEL